MTFLKVGTDQSAVGLVTRCHLQVLAAATVVENIFDCTGTGRPSSSQVDHTVLSAAAAMLHQLSGGLPTVAEIRALYPIQVNSI
jgi:hypothetical protein